MLHDGHGVFIGNIHFFKLQHKPFFVVQCFMYNFGHINMISRFHNLDIIIFIQYAPPEYDRRDMSFTRGTK